MPMTDRIVTYLGFARKMGKLKAGMALEKSLDEGDVVLLLLFPTISDKNRDKLLRREKGVQTIVMPDIDFARLGLQPCKALGVTDEGLAKAIVKTYEIKEVPDERHEK